MVGFLYSFECRLFRSLNQHFDKKLLNFYFRHITHVGGALFTISSLLILLTIATTQSFRTICIASALALAISHIPVAIVKKVYPRKRPYLALQEIRVGANPLEDHSFPSGHTTAIFSVVTPFILSLPILAVILVPLAISVALSRVYLGLHYPSDVLVGFFLGSTTGVTMFSFLHHLV
ncbi:phosphatase PAP2 family protein [Bacillus sp. HMF5848]|nr:phosphatase PAP2 family protein [Bacillus sp. HMF5848]